MRKEVSLAVFDKSSQSKQKLASKRRSKIVKIDPYQDRLSKPLSRLWFSSVSLTWWIIIEFVKRMSSVQWVWRVEYTYATLHLRHVLKVCSVNLYFANSRFKLSDEVCSYKKYNKRELLKVSKLWRGARGLIFLFHMRGNKLANSKDGQTRTYIY